MMPSLFVVPDVSVTAMAGTGSGFTVMVDEAVAVQPFSVTVTVYEVVEAGVTVIAAVVAPVLQAYVPPPEAVKVADAPAQMMPSLFVVPEVSVTAIAGTGSGFTVMVDDAVTVQPISVTVTVYEVVVPGVTVIAAVVAPVLQEYVPPPEAVKVADAPAQMMPSLFVVPDVSVTAIAGTGSGFTVMVDDAVAVQPISVTVTVYEVVVPGVTVIAAVVAPVLQEYVPPPEAVRVADAPAQMMPSLFVVPDVSVTAIEGTGSGFTVMVAEAVPVQPISVTVTVYEVVVPGDTVIAAVVALVLQTYVPPPEAVKVADAPAQMMPSLFVVPEVSVTAIAGTGSGFTVMVDDEVAVQPFRVTVTVYEVVDAGVTVIAPVVAPVLQEYVPPPDAVKVADAPAQIMPSLFVVPDVSVTAIAGTGSGLTVMVDDAVAVQPFRVTVTV